MTFSKEVVNEYFGLPTLGDGEGFIRVLREIDMATITTTICKPGIVWKKSGDVFRHFPRKCLLDKFRPWYTFVYANLLPTAHLSDVSRDRAILLYAIMTGASIDVGRVIFDHYMHCV